MTTGRARLEGHLKGTAAPWLQPGLGAGVLSWIEVEVVPVGAEVDRAHDQEPAAGTGNGHALRLAEPGEVGGIEIELCQLDAGLGDAQVRLARWRAALARAEAAAPETVTPGTTPAAAAEMVLSGVRARMRTIAPMLSPVVWTSMATGVVPARHGILDFVATTANEGERVPVTATQVFGWRAELNRSRMTGTFLRIKSPPMTK